MNSKIFYETKVTQHCFLQDAYDTIEETIHVGSIVITGPHIGCGDSDI